MPITQSDISNVLRDDDTSIHDALHSNKAYIITWAVIGGIAGLAILFVAVCYCCGGIAKLVEKIEEKKRNRRATTEPTTSSTKTISFKKILSSNKAP